MDIRENLKGDVVEELFDIGAIKFGDFTLKSGIKSPFYIDLRVTITKPSLLRNISDIMWNTIISKLQKQKKIDYLCGVPYAALPVATWLSVEKNQPMLIKRKEAKEHGTKKLIEGDFKTGESCIIIEDVVTSGTSVIETNEALKKVGLKVHDVAVLIDREQGGHEVLEAQGLQLHALFTIKQITQILVERNRIDKTTFYRIAEWVRENQVLVAQTHAGTSVLQMDFEERSKATVNKMSYRLMKLIHQKKTNLCVAVDVTQSEDLIKIADTVGSQICMLKTHVEILEDFTMETVTQLKELAKKHNFFIFQDSKFSDIGNTVKNQYARGLYNIAEWADFVTAHAVSGPGIIQSLRQVAHETQEDRGLFLVVEMSSQGNLANGDYRSKACTMAENHLDMISGLIAQRHLAPDVPGLLTLTPGVKLQQGQGSLGQKYNTPDTLIKGQGTDIIIVGRGVCQAEDPYAEASKYRDHAWSAFEHRIAE
eukprot:gb/GECH01001479.1/.p1 GENE.gb/GECH01001479.1/~~gb/GECH01001479.1/.p1  ORF type:complete len:481 (+),score=119.62 gb/GECH01001479.1/:1-1443(+)